MGDTNDTINTFDGNRQPWLFVSLVMVDIPAIVCTLVILSFFFSHWYSMIKKALHHHAIFLLTIISLLYTTFDLPFTMNYFRLGYYPYRSISFCLWWYWFDYSLFGMSLFLTATASVQRHIVIFHSQWLHARKRRWTLHYIPLIISVVYPQLFYIAFMFLYPCTLYYDPTVGWCTYPCYIDNTILYNIDWLLNNILPVLIIALANVTLIIRVVRSMRRVRQQQRGTWKRQKKLTLQLLAFSSLYMAVWLPTTTVALLHVLAFPNLYNDVPNLYQIYDMFYFVFPLQSFLFILALPELVDFIKRKSKRMLLTGSRVVPFITV